MIAPQGLRRATPWEDARPPLVAGDSSASLGGMTRAMTMLELSDIHELNRLGEAVDAVARESELAREATEAAAAGEAAQPLGQPRRYDDDEDSDGGFFIDASDYSSERVGGFLSSSPDLVTNVPEPEEPAPPPKDTSSSGGVGMMRRVMSMASMPSQKVGLSSMLLQPVPTISEEGGSPEPQKSARERKPSLVRSSTSSNCSDFQPESLVPLNDVGVERWPSHTKSGMPLRSAMKGSRNNLRASGHSLASSATSLDETNHSLDGSERSAPGGTPMKRNVSFSSLEIRNYGVTLGDAPTPRGAPVTLDWTYDPSATESYNVDFYEQFRTDEAPRRRRHEMHMGPMQRQLLLMREAGFTRGEIRRAAEECKRVALRRERTVKLTRMGLMPVEEAWEKTRRTIGKMGGKGKR